MAPPRLHIRLLGPMVVSRDGTPLDLPRSKKARALLAYLVATRQAFGRGQLCDLLWDGPADPRAELRWALAKIRPLLDDAGSTRLVTDRNRVGFEAGTSSIDLLTLRASIPDAPADADTAPLQRAAALLRGPFLEGLDLPECYRFDAWCVAERETLHQLHESVLHTLVKRLADTPEAALGYARDRILLDPLSEDAHAGLIRLLANLGRVDEARARFERCRRMLAQEFGRQPSPELEGIRRSIKRGKPARRSPRRAAADDNHGAEPLAGRQSECLQLGRFVNDGLAAKPLGMTLIAGEPGIGKTRMLAALAQRVAAAGGLCIRGRAYEVEHVRPYAVWIDALRTCGTNLIPEPLHRDLAPLLPELGDFEGAPTQRVRLFDAVVALLCDLAATHGLVGVIIDDLQWLDEASVALTHHVARKTRGERVLFAAAARAGDLSGSAAAAATLTRTLQGNGQLTTMALTPLDADATAQLVARIAPRLDSARVFAESDGNPLFIREIARAMSHHGEVLDDTLFTLIGARLQGIESAAGDLVPWIAALGRRFNFDMLAAVSKRSAADLLPALKTLEQQAVIRADTEDGYEFVHDVIRQVAYERMAAPTRRMIHLQIARQLRRAMAREPVRASEVARHAEQGGDHELAAWACVLAGRHGLRIFAYEDVVASINRGLRQIKHVAANKCIEMHLELLGLYGHSGMMPYWPNDLEAHLWALHDQARAEGRNDQFHAGYRILAMLYYQRGARGDALSLVQSSEYHDTALTPSARVDALVHTAGCMGMLGRHMPRARQLLQEAEALVAEHGLTLGNCHLPLVRGLIAHHDGELDAARQAFERALAVARSDDPVPWWEYYCLSRLPMIELERAAPDAALARCDALARVADRLGPGGEAPFSAALRALSESACGDAGPTPAVDQALARLRDADSRAMIAYVQNMAAGLDLAHGDPVGARSRSAEALQAATVVEDCSEAAIARARLVECSDKADKYLNALAGALESPEQLSARAQRIAEAVTKVKGT